MVVQDTVQAIGERHKVTRKRLSELFIGLGCNWVAV